MSDSTIGIAESVTEGHPDKVCDLISDAILDEILAQDPFGRCACEILLTRGLVLVAGEISTNARVELAEIVRRVVGNVGYTDAALGLDSEACAVVTAINGQSCELEDALEAGGANDQALVFGYACDDTDDLMPMPIWLAHRLSRRLADVRRDETLPYLRPDGKVQVAVSYEGGTPTGLESIVIAAQHDPDVDRDEMTSDLLAHVVEPLVPEALDLSSMRFAVNRPGPFVTGGAAADTGLTGRKVIVDSYGGAARHGGGALSGKDPSKIDRSAAYGARWIAKHIVARGLARRAEVQLSYAIGEREPTSFSVEMFGTGSSTSHEIEREVRRCFDLTPAGWIRDLDLRRPIYERTACYGHFGRSDVDLPWESIQRMARSGGEATG